MAKKNKIRWVENKDVFEFDGTQKAVDELVKRAKDYGYTPLDGVALYETAEKCFVLTLIDKNNNRLGFISDMVVVFGKKRMRLYGSMEKALEENRVRTHLARVTIRIEQDDTIKEIIIPAARSVNFNDKPEDDQEYDFFDPRSWLFTESGRAELKIGRMYQNNAGAMYYVVDRVQNPDMVVPEYPEAHDANAQ